MNAIEMLQQDHQGAKKAMEELEKSSGDKKKKLFDALKHELEIHDKIEETIFYPALKSHAQASGLASADKAAHEEVEAALDKLAKLPVEDKGWDGAFKAMQAKLLKHVADEETNIFLKVRQVLSIAELNTLGEKMKVKKDEMVKLVGSSS